MPSSSGGGRRLDLAHGARTSLRSNATAYAYSVFITACFGIVDTVVGGRGVGRIFLLVVGATLAFAVSETVASRGFRDRFRPEPSDVVMLGSTMALFSVGTAAGVAWSASILLRSGWAWLLAPFLGTLTYILVSSLEMAIARRKEEQDPPEQEK